MRPWALDAEISLACAHLLSSMRSVIELASSFGIALGADAASTNNARNE
jgi:hypothetical protein